MMNIVGRRVAALSLLWAAGAVASAQEQEAAPLQGPRVVERAVPGVHEQYVPGDLGRMTAAGHPIPLLVYFQALRDLEDAGTPLTRDQTALVRAEVADFRARIAGFLDAHGEEVRGLIDQLSRQERGRAIEELGQLERLARMLDRVEAAGGFDRLPARAARRGNDGVDGDPDEADAPTGEGFELEFRERAQAGEGEQPGMAPMTETDAAPSPVRNRLLELRAAAPSPAQLQTRIWETLDEAQRETLGAALSEYQASEQKRFQEQRLARAMEAQRRRQADRAPTDRLLPEFDDQALQRLDRTLESGEIPERLWSTLPEQLRSRLEQLPEAERAGALRRLLEAVRKNRGRPADARPRD